MLPWQHLATTTVPGGGDMTLKRRGQEFSIKLGQIELMNSRLSGSEEAMATETQARLGGKSDPVLLIGGLGMGFTLRAALATFGPKARITVAELVPAITEWARGPMAELFGDCLDDPRTLIHTGDVGRLMEMRPGTFDAILLDVDNGPEGLTRADNDWLYSHAGLAVARRALKPGGWLVIWSCAPDDAFTRRLSQARFDVEVVRIRAHRGKSGARHVLWMARHRT